MTNRKWVTLHILWKAVSSYLLLWPTGSEWHCTFLKCNLITCFPMTNSEWVTFHILWMGWFLSHFCLWPTIASGWHCIFYETVSESYVHMTNSKWVISYILCKEVSSYLFLWSIASESVTLHILWKGVSSHLPLWPTACEWHCTLCERDHSFSYDQQGVSDIEHLWKAGDSSLAHLFTGSEWDYTFCERQSHCIFAMTNSKWVRYCTFCERWSHHIFSYDQQPVSNITHFVKTSLMTLFPMTDSLWVILHILWNAVSSHLFQWLIACEWHCTFCERQSYHFFYYEQQEVSNITHYVKRSFITFSLWPTGSEWLCTVCEMEPYHYLLWPTGCEWHCRFCERESYHIISYHQQEVSDIADFVKGHLFLWTTASEWHCTFCERQSHHIFSCDQQEVSDIAHCVKGSLITSFPTTNSKWVKSHIFERDSSYLFLWPTVCEWDCTFCEQPSHPSFNMTNSL